MTNMQSRLNELSPPLELLFDEEKRRSYRQDKSGCRGEIPIAVAKPANVKQIVDLVAASSETGTKLQVASSRGERYRGETLCAANTVVVDMSAFDEVVRTDRRNRMLMFEAGVDFASLYRSAKKAGLRPMLPLCPHPEKSALTAYLDREPIIYPKYQWDASDPLLCLEAIMGNGRFFRTGGAAGPGRLEDQWKAGDAQKFPMGPGASDLMRIFQGAQGGYGIVTWCSAKAEAIPVEETLFVVESSRLEQLIELAYDMLRWKLPDICLFLNETALRAIRSRKSKSGIASKTEDWSLVFSISRPKIAGHKKIAYVRNDIEALLKKHRIKTTPDSGKDGSRKLHRLLTDPTDALNRSWWKLAGKASTRELFFQTTMDRVPKLLASARQVCLEQGWDWNGVLQYLQPQTGGRYCHMELIFPHDETPADGLPEQLNRLLPMLTRQLKAEGAYFGRPYRTFGDAPFQNESGLSIIKRIKNILDPDSIFSPNGIQYPETD